MDGDPEPVEAQAPAEAAPEPPPKRLKLTYKRELSTIDIHDLRRANVAIKIQQTNPKRPGTKSHERYGVAHARVLRRR